MSFLITFSSVICVSTKAGLIQPDKIVPYDAFNRRKTRPVDQKKVEQKQNHFNYWLDSLVTRGFHPGVTAGVVIGNELAYVKYSGSAGPKSLYGLASVTKTFTAFGLMRLVEQGRVDINKPVSFYLPKVKIARKELNSETVLVRHLLSHTSGLPDVRYYRPSAKEWKSASQLGLNFRIPSQIYPAGRHYRYSNHNFKLLGAIIEKQSGMSLKEYFMKRVFAPLGMHDTRTSSWLSGAGGIRTSLPDLARYASMWLGKGVSVTGERVLKEQTIQTMLKEQTHIPYATNKKYVGLAWRAQKDSHGVVTFFHIGGANHVSAWVQMFPGYNAAVVYLGNPPSYDNGLMAQLVYMQNKLGSLATEMTGAHKNVRSFTATKLDPENWPIYLGSYRNLLTDEQITLKLEAGDIYLEWPSGNSRKLEAATTNSFYFPAYEVSFSKTTNKVLGFSGYNGYYHKLNNDGTLVEIDDFNARLPLVDTQPPKKDLIKINKSSIPEQYLPALVN